jgi:biotin-(acetyl-CoA carboxylase) ligase
LLGKKVRVRAGDAVLEGLAQELDGSGGLVLVEPTGAVHRLTTGSVTVLSRDYEKSE